MNKNNIISLTNNLALKLKALIKEKETDRSKLEVTAEKLAETAIEKESVRRDLEITAEKLAETAKEKETARTDLAQTAEKLQTKAEELAATAKEIESANKYSRSLIEASLDPLVTISPEGKVTDVNEATIKVTGVTREQLIGTDFSDYFTEPEKSRAGYKKVFREGSVTDYPLTIRSKKGKLTDVLYNASVYKDDKGNVLGVFAAARDVTEAKKANELMETVRRKLAVTDEELKVKAENLATTAEEKEDVRQKLAQTAKQLAASAKEKETVRRDLVVTAEKLRLNAQELEETKAKEEAIFESIGDGIISVDNEAKITRINLSACKILGLKQEDVIGKKFFEMVKIEDEQGKLINEKNRPIAIAMTGSTITTTGSKYYYVRKNKTKFPAAVTARPAILGGKVIGAVEVFRDVTTEIEVDRAKTEFISLASHQLRTPLSAINWYSEMLLNGDAGEISPKQKEYVNEIHQGNTRMISLVSSLLSVTRIDLKTFTISVTDIEVQKICDEVIKELTVDIDKKKLKIEKNYDKSLSQIKADPNYIRIIFQNLLTNAVKYTRENGKIEVGIKMHGGKILITVKDNGFGIPKSAQSMIFTKLYRADNAVAHDPNGNGLGLYIVKSIVEQTAKGKIWFDSVENRGTTFYVELPLGGMKKRKGKTVLT